MISLLLIAGCSDWFRPTPPNVLWITLDTTRADHLGLYGYFRDTSPHLDALARESVVFERCLVPVAVTLPSHTSMLTGVFPFEHGVLANNASDRRWVRAPLPTLTTWLAERGYRTGGFVSGAPLRRGTGVEEGFSTWTEPLEGDTVRRGAGATDDLLSFIGDGREPFFGWLHLFDAHGARPLAEYAALFPPDPRVTAWTDERVFKESLLRGGNKSVPVTTLIDRYDAEIRYMDDQIGRVLDAGRAAGWLDRTILVVVGDHGEGLGQHGLSAHGFVWDEQLRAPLIVRAPGVAARRVSEPVSVVDLVPTVLGRLDLPGEGALLGHTSGVDALGAIPDRVLLAQSSAKSRQNHERAIALTRGTWRYQREVSGAERLFDLATDPFELRDLSTAEPERVAELRAIALAEEERQRERGRAFGAGATAPQDPSQRELLEELGYVE